MARKQNTRSIIVGAMRVWARKGCDASCADQCRTFKHSWGRSHDYTVPVKRDKVWTARDFAAYQRRTRYLPLKEG